MCGDLLDIGVPYGVVKKSGSNYYFGENKLGLGRENAKATLKADPKLQKEIRSAIEKAILTPESTEVLEEIESDNIAADI